MVLPTPLSRLLLPSALKIFLGTAGRFRSELLAHTLHFQQHQNKRSDKSQQVAKNAGGSPSHFSLSAAVSRVNVVEALS
jgi:hypothetical protein